MLRDRLNYIARLVSLAVLMSLAGMLVIAFIKRGSKIQPLPPIEKTKARLSEKVVAITDGYEYVSNENGKLKFRLAAARDTSYADGHHELDKLTLIDYAPDGSEHGRIVADHGIYKQDQDEVTFTGHVVATQADGLEVQSESLSYQRQTKVANSAVAVNFKRGEMSGSSVGAILHAQEKKLALLKDARLLITPTEQKHRGAPVEIRGQHAEYTQLDGVARFSGEVNVTQGDRLARADQMVGYFDPKTHKLLRVEARGNSYLKSQSQGKTSELQSRDQDFLFDEAQQLKLLTATGQARAASLEKDAPREIVAEKIEAHYVVINTGAPSSELESIVTQGRTTMKIPRVEGAASATQATERVVEADGMRMSFRTGGKLLARTEASGNAVLTVTPPVGPTAERKRMRAPSFTADFYDAGNAIKNFLAEGGVIVEFEPLQADSKRSKRTLTGKRLNANFQEQAQEVSSVTVDDDAKFTDGKRNATATRAIYTAATQMVALRGKPLVWDADARTDANEIDTNVDTNESTARGRVRTTYYSRDTTGGAAPFKKSKSPVFLTADRAWLRHQEGAARYEGNARAWQDDNFVRAETIELDKNERVMTATNGVQSALYNVEREVEKGRKEVVPIFATADRMTYTDATRIVHYEGNTKIKQGTDRIDAAVADAVIDEEHKLSKLTAMRNVVLTQPARRGTGDKIEYTAASDTAILTGNLARLEDREREVATSSARLTLHLRDAKIEADDEGGTKRVTTTHRIQQ